MLVSFTQVHLPGAAFPPPTPSSKTLPEWYAKLPHGATFDARTIKACVPFMDAMTAGFVIPCPTDIIVKNDPSDKSKAVFLGLEAIIESHRPEQVSGAPTPNPMKFTNPWLIKTEPGVSCLFKQPELRGLPFRVFEAIVDTDTYPNRVNFPFALADPKWRGIIHKGTPMVQVIPFRREASSFEIIESTPESEASVIAASNLISEEAKGAGGSYRRRWWHKSKENHA